MAPNAPANLAGPDDGNTVVVLNWELPGPDNDATNADVLGTGGAPITSVEIQRWNGSTVQWDTIRTHPVALTDVATPAYTDASEAYTDTGLDDGTMYTYRVRAVNAAGESPWSNMDSATTADAAPDKPVLSATVEGQDVVLSWTVPDDNGAAITAYQIQRFPSIADNGDPNNDWGDDVGNAGRDGDQDAVDDNDADDVILPMPVGATTYTDRDLLPGTTYYYRIRGVNIVNLNVNGGARTWSPEFQVTTAPKAPDKMTLTLAGGEEKVTLTWVVPDNNGSPITEYQIERWNIVSRSWQLIKDELPVSVTTFEETGLAEGTRYFYRIRAVNAGGGGAWSTLTFAVTKAAAE